TFGNSTAFRDGSANEHRRHGRSIFPNSRSFLRGPQKKSTSAILTGSSHGLDASPTGLLFKTSLTLTEKPKLQEPRTSLQPRSVASLDGTVTGTCRRSTGPQP